MKLTRIALMIAALAVITGTQAFGQRRTTARQYIETYKDMAIEEMDIYGIPASITLAQGLLESDCGNSRLATEANNHFGIKCKSTWTGPTITHDDDAPGECFRKYSSAADSYRDHSVFLDQSARYEALFDLDIMDYKGWAQGLKDAGYATNPQYANLLIKVIEENNLYLYDLEWLEGENSAVLVDNEPVRRPEPRPVPEISAPQAEFSEKIDIDNYVVSVRSLGSYAVYYNNGSEFIVARQGDTYEKLARTTGLSSKKLRKFNDRTESMQPATGEPVYIKSKAKRANNGKLIHIVKEGETMHSISQAYGIKLSKLASLNRRGADARLTAGQQIRLM